MLHQLFAIEAGSFASPEYLLQLRKDVLDTIEI